MPFEEINAYTPQLYRSLGTPVTLDLNLGSTATEITALGRSVGGVPDAVVTALKPARDGITQLLTDSQAHGAAITALQQQATQGFRDVLVAISKLPAPAPEPAEVTLTDNSTVLVRPLTQLLGQVIEANSPDKLTEAAAKLLKLSEAEAQKLLKDDAELLDGYRRAFRKFDATEHGERYRRYAEVHALIPAITAHLAA